MKYLSLLIIGSLIVFTNAGSKDEIVEKLMSMVPPCKPDITRQDYEDVITNVIDAKSTTKCLRHCLLVGFNMLSGEKLNVFESGRAFGTKYGTNSEGEAIAETCNKKVTVKDKCEAAHEYFICGVDETKKLGKTIDMPT